MSIKVAVIGAGAMGRNHVRVYYELPGVQLVGVSDVDEAGAAAATRLYATRTYTDYRQMLEETQPDAVTIAVPTEHHLEVALDVISRGVHLLIEKPIASTVDEGQQIIDAAAQANVHLQIGHIERFNPAVIALRQQLAENALGKVYQIDARRQGPFPGRIKDVGVVVDLAVHDIDVIRYITGAEITRVYAETAQRIHETREDMVTGLLRLDNGAVGTLTINWLTPTKIRELYVTGERGMFRVDYLTQDLYFFENAAAPVGDWPFLNLRGVNEGRMIRHVVAKKEPLRAELESFLAAIKGENPVPVTGQDGLKSLTLAQALVQSGLNAQPQNF
ncbi:MAG: Gfo/Idh/MocA family oxidoreductase [Anaerolineae bacterium]|nr:Gfo/Idh/MocA family oxidoreductase [Anaerolineae bacterium]